MTMTRGLSDFIKATFRACFKSIALWQEGDATATVGGSGLAVFKCGCAADATYGENTV